MFLLKVPLLETISLLIPKSADATDSIVSVLQLSFSEILYIDNG